MEWNTIEWTEHIKKSDRLNPDIPFERTGINLPTIGEKEYLVCLKNGDHFVALYDGNKDEGWFYVEDLPALYPLAWAEFTRYKNE